MFGIFGVWHDPDISVGFFLPNRCAILPCSRSMASSNLKRAADWHVPGEYKYCLPMSNGVCLCPLSSMASIPEPPTRSNTPQIMDAADKVLAALRAGDRASSTAIEASSTAPSTSPSPVPSTDKPSAPDPSSIEIVSYLTVELEDLAAHVAAVTPVVGCRLTAKFMGPHERCAAMILFESATHYVEVFKTMDRLDQGY